MLQPVHRFDHHARPGVPELLLRIVLFLLIAIAAIVVLVGTAAWWTTALALAGLVLALTGVLVSVLELLADDTQGEMGGGGRAAALALGVAAMAALVAAIVVPERAAAKPHGATPATADATVEHFLTVGIVEDNAYLACQYLTPAAQQRVARVAGTPTCRAALTASPPSFAGIQSDADVKALSMRATVRGGRATVVVTPPAGRGGPATFGLRPATPRDYDAFQAPPDPWRIDSGVRAVLP
jgi:hypothetical protein